MRQHLSKMDFLESPKTPDLNTDYDMGYSKFIQELAKGMDGKIIGYANTDDENGCLIYLRNRDHRIFVPAEVIVRKRTEVIQLLRQKINEGLTDTTLLALRNDGNKLIFEQRENTE